MEPRIEFFAHPGTIGGERFVASGHVSGELRDWSYLADAFRRLGLDVAEDAGAVTMRPRAREELQSRGCSSS